MDGVHGRTIVLHFEEVRSGLGKKKFHSHMSQGGRRKSEQRRVPAPYSPEKKRTKIVLRQMRPRTGGKKKRHFLKELF